jgi:hypothetical protein
MSTEMIFMVFEHATLDVLMNLRLTNSCAKAVVESWCPFREIYSSGPDLVRAAIAIKASKFLSVPRLLAVTFGDRCELCGQLGSFVQLVKCMRCCFHCLAADRRLHCVSQDFATRYVHINFTNDLAARVEDRKIMQQNLERIPKVHTIPQKSFWGHPLTGRLFALDYNAAIQSGGPTIKARSLPSILQKRIAAGKGRPCYHEMPSLVGCIDAGQSLKRRFLTAIYQPGILGKTLDGIPTSEHARFCRGCREYWGLHSPGRHHLEHIMYSSSEIVLHLSQCIFAKLAWTMALILARPNPVNLMVPIPLESLAADVRWSRCLRVPEHGGLPITLMHHLHDEYQVQGQLTYGDSLIEETQANWALAQQVGSVVVPRYTGFWGA